SNKGSITQANTKTQDFTQSLQRTSSIAINKTDSSDIVVSGPGPESPPGIDHDFDVVLLWLNPVANVVISGNNTAQIVGYSFHSKDPVNEMDVVPVYVGWLKNPSTMPPGVALALARTWADQPDDGSGTGLTSNDFTTILARDPFAGGATAIDTSRFVLSGET